MKTIGYCMAILSILFFYGCSTDDVQPTVPSGPADQSNLFTIKDAAFGEYLKYLKVPGVYAQAAGKAEATAIGYVIDTVESKKFSGEINLSKTAKSIEKLVTAGLTTAEVKIKDLDGIQYFTGVTILNVISNEVSRIDVSKLVNLTELTLNFNAISEIDLTQNTRLQKLTYKRSTSAIPTDGTSLSSIDLSRNTALTDLVLTYQNLTTINLTNNTKLTTLDLSSNTGTPFAIPENIYNNLTGGSSGVNPGGTTPDPDPLPDPEEGLYAVNKAFGEYLEYRLKESFPDVMVVKEGNYLIDEAKAAEVNIALELSKNSKIPDELAAAGLSTAADKLTDLDGIQLFTGITSLKLTSNELTSIDVTTLAELTELNLNNNMIGTLDVTKNIKLLTLSYNASSKSKDSEKLSSIDLSQNKALTDLSMTKHLLETINLDNNTALTKIDLSGNPGADFPIPAAIYNQAAKPTDMKGVKPV